MSKYIDAELLRKEIEKVYNSEIAPWLSGVSATSAIYDYVLPLIDSLKQKQLEETVEGQVFGAADVQALYEGKVYVISNLVQDTDYNIHPHDKVKMIILKEDEK